MDNRHSFLVLSQLGPEADRLGVKVVDAYGQSVPATDFLDKIVFYIKAREDEIDRLRLTDAEREAVEWSARQPFAWVNQRNATLRAMLARLT